MITKPWFPVLLLFVPSAVAATVPLEPFAGANFTVSMPKSWTVAEDAANALVSARQDPRHDDSAAVLFLIKSADASVSEDQLLDTVAQQIAQNLNIAKREAVPGGGRMMIADGALGGNRVRVGVIARKTGGASLVCLLISKPADFDGLGGIELVSKILTSLKARDTPAAPPSITRGGPAASPNGKGDVPPPSRPLNFADLTGEWNNDDSVMSHYVNYRGDSAGFESIKTREKWIFDGRGGVSSGFNAVTSGRSGTRQVNENKSGSVVFSQGSVMTLAWRGASRSSYVIRGWRELPGMTVLMLNGPWYDSIPADVLADRGKGTNLNSYWVRKSNP